MLEIIGTLAGILSFLLSVLLEWDRIKGRFNTSNNNAQKVSAKPLPINESDSHVQSKFRTKGCLIGIFIFLLPIIGIFIGAIIGIIVAKDNKVLLNNIISIGFGIGFLMGLIWALISWSQRSTSKINQEISVNSAVRQKPTLFKSLMMIVLLGPSIGFILGGASGTFLVHKFGMSNFAIGSLAMLGILVGGVIGGLHLRYNSWGRFFIYLSVSLFLIVMA